jgi:hypothetical protein
MEVTPRRTRLGIGLIQPSDGYSETSIMSLLRGSLTTSLVCRFSLVIGLVDMSLIVYWHFRAMSVIPKRLTTLCQCLVPTYIVHVNGGFITSLVTRSMSLIHCPLAGQLFVYGPMLRG